MMEALIRAAERTHTVVISKKYTGKYDLLVIYGVGNPERHLNRIAHVASDRRVFCWDMGYFGRKKPRGYLRISIDADHPQAWLTDTTPDPSRWREHDIRLREDYKRNGHIVLVGLGPKSKVHHGIKVLDWERNKLEELKVRFPAARILFRPKPRRIFPNLRCETDSTSPIEDVLRGARLVVCRHSNVAVDAIVAGIPYECEDGAAIWLKDGATVEERLDFLYRLSWWQWRPDEADLAWQFLMERRL